jgi:hypothetical protein
MFNLIIFLPSLSSFKAFSFISYNMLVYSPA